MITKRKNGVVLNVLAQPGSKDLGLIGIQENRLKIRLTAKAVDGAANNQLCEFLSKKLHISKSSIILTSGALGRRKTLFIEGDSDAILKRLELLLAPPISQ
ncbi:MAG TPA: DUF167 domain-containing protein [Oculatellaceae cyanobacterium]